MMCRSNDPKHHDRPAAADTPRCSRAARRCRMRSFAQATLVALLFEAGCASSPPLHYHTLVAVAPAVPAPASAPTAACGGRVLQIADVHLPAQLDRAELLREFAPGRFEVSENDHWAAPLSSLARQALAEDLEARLPAGRTAFPGAAWPAADAQLTVNVLSFTLRNGEASMLLSWSLQASGGATPEAGAQWQLRTPAADEAVAFSALLAQLADRLAAALTGCPSAMQG